MVNILESLARYIAVQFLKQPQRMIQPDDALISSGLIDSFNLVDLAVYIEDTYGVHLDDTELNRETFDTLNQLVELIVERMKP